MGPGYVSTFPRSFITRVTLLSLLLGVGPSYTQADQPPNEQTRPAPPPVPCCKHCTKGCPCGNSCISCQKVCHKPPGCACSG